MSVEGRGLGDLVEYDDRSRRQRPVGEVVAEAGDRARPKTGRVELGDRLRRGCDSHHRPAVSGRATRSDMGHHGLAIASGGEHRPERSTRAAQHRHRLTLIRTQESDGTEPFSDSLWRDRYARAFGESVEYPKRVVFDGALSNR